MTDEGRRYKDPELDRFFHENKEMIEELLKEEREMFKTVFKAEKEKMESMVEEKKAKAKETSQQMMGMFADPEVQKHFMTMGMEFLLGMSALIQASPLPDAFKDVVNKTEETGKASSERSRKSGTGTKTESKVSKVDIKDNTKKETTPRKRTTKTKNAE